MFAFTRMSFLLKRIFKEANWRSFKLHHTVGAKTLQFFSKAAVINKVCQSLLFLFFRLQSLANDDLKFVFMKFTTDFYTLHQSVWISAIAFASLCQTRSLNNNISPISCKWLLRGKTTKFNYLEERWRLAVLKLNADKKELLSRVWRKTSSDKTVNTKFKENDINDLCGSSLPVIQCPLTRLVPTKIIQDEQPVWTKIKSKIYKQRKTTS